MTARFIRQIRDSNHKEVVEFVQAHGYEVIETFQPVDILIYNAHLGQSGWAEIKTEKRDAKIKRTQIKFMALTRMPVAFVRTGEEALEFARTLLGLTSRQKDNLAIFLRDAKGSQFGPAVIERILEWK